MTPSTVLDIVSSKVYHLDIGDHALIEYIEEVGQSIMNYCNREDIPSGLRYVHANMVVDLIKAEKRKVDPDAQTGVKSIKEGDVSVEFGAVNVESRERATEKLLYDYSKQLNSFRKLRW